MANNRIVALETILKQEKAKHIKRQNISSSYMRHLDGLYSTYISMHMKNIQIYGEMVEQQLRRETSDKEIRRLHIFYINDPLSFNVSEVMKKYVAKVPKGDGVLLIDLVDKRDRDVTGIEGIYGYGYIDEFMSGFSELMSYMYHLLTDLFDGFTIHANNSVFPSPIDANVVDNKIFILQPKPTFMPGFVNKHD